MNGVSGDDQRTGDSAVQRGQNGLVRLSEVRKVPIVVGRFGDDLQALSRSPRTKKSAFWLVQDAETIHGTWSGLISIQQPLFESSNERGNYGLYDCLLCSYLSLSSGSTCLST
jgi:hypothetical protein